MIIFIISALSVCKGQSYLACGLLLILRHRRVKKTIGTYLSESLAVGPRHLNNLVLIVHGLGALRGVRVYRLEKAHRKLVRLWWNGGAIIHASSRLSSVAALGSPIFCT